MYKSYVGLLLVQNKNNVIHSSSKKQVCSPMQNLFIQYSGAKAHALQWGGSRLYIDFEIRKP